MADFQFNISRGRVVELYKRVDAGDPSASRLVWLVLKTTGLESDATLQDYDTVADILAASNDEVTNTGYARVVVTASDLATASPDDTNNRWDLDIPDVDWVTVSSGDVWAKLILCYTPDQAGGTDSDKIPLLCYDFSVTPNGAGIRAVINTSGFFRAA